MEVRGHLAVGRGQESAPQNCSAAVCALDQHYRSRHLLRHLWCKRNWLAHIAVGAKQANVRSILETGSTKKLGNCIVAARKLQLHPRLAERRYRGAIKSIT